MNILGIIPMRMASSRFPGKPLAIIDGIPMAGHVFYRSKKSNLITNLCIATCDDEIRSYSKSIGATCIMTSDKHERASDRTAEAVEKWEITNECKIDIVMMIQGDEPMVQPAMLDDAVKPLIQDNDLQISNLMAPIKTQADFKCPDVVKVVVDLKMNALYFSREPIPSRKKAKQSIPLYKQLGLIAFKRAFLSKYSSLKQTPLEILESVDMLRILENGYTIKMVLTQFSSIGVDTPKDLKRAQIALSSDPLRKTYG